MSKSAKPNQHEMLRRTILPAGYAAVPLSAPAADGREGPVNLCIVVSRGSEGGEGSTTGADRRVRPVVLEEGVGARTLLGCLIDAAGRVLRWMDVHVQAVETVHSAMPAYREGLSNAILDERWGNIASAEEAGLPGELVMTTGWERSHPLPLLVDPESMAAVHPRDEQGNAWVLCRDEGALAAAGLPSYSGSLHRYLYGEGGESGFVPVTPDAPTNEKTRERSALTADCLIPLNISCGLIRARGRCTSPLEPFIDVLSAEPAKAVLRIDPWPLENQAERMEYQPFVEGGLLLSRHGERGRLVEVYHLKLRLLAEAVSGVRSWVQKMQSPLLNISASSFGVEVGGLGAGLPTLWTSRAVLTRPGDAAALRIPGADAEYFVPGRAGAGGAGRGTSIYQPESAGRAVEGRASVRVRKVAREPAPGVAIVSGTFATQERINPKVSDLTWIRMHAGGQPIDLYARLERAEGLASGEWRFTTVPQHFGDDGVRALQEAEGVTAADAPFQTLPLLSTPCDLYSLGVLGVRTMLVGREMGLAEALDELLSLARVAMEPEGAGVGLGARVRAVLASERKWMESLGPQRLVEGLASPETALELVPLEVWSDTLASVMRMFPGLTGESACRDLGDAPAAGLHSVFDRAAADLERLLIRTRSLVVIDWQQNREVHSIIRRHRTGLAGNGSGSGEKASRLMGGA